MTMNVEDAAMILESVGYRVNVYDRANQMTVCYNGHKHVMRTLYLVKGKIDSDIIDRLVNAVCDPT